MSQRAGTILEDLPGVLGPEDIRRGRPGRRTSVGIAVSDSVPESGVVTPESDENSSISSDMFFI